MGVDITMIAEYRTPSGWQLAKPLVENPHCDPTNYGTLGFPHEVTQRIDLGGIKFS